MTRPLYKVRIGNDVPFEWRIVCNGEEVDLEGKDLRVSMIRPNGSRLVLPHEVEGNVVKWTLRGVDQHELGEYYVSLWENYGKPGQSVVDSGAVEIVAASCMAGNACVEHNDPVELGPSDLTLGNVVSIREAEQVVKSEETGGENVLRITLSSGRTVCMVVRNGGEGEEGKTGAPGKDLVWDELTEGQKKYIYEQVTSMVEEGTRVAQIIGQKLDAHPKIEELRKKAEEAGASAKASEAAAKDAEAQAVAANNAAQAAASKADAAQKSAGDAAATGEAIKNTLDEFAASGDINETAIAEIAKQTEEIVKLKQINNNLIGGGSEEPIEMTQGGYYTTSGNGVKLTTTTSGYDYYSGAINLSYYIGKEVKIITRWNTTGYVSSSNRVLFVLSDDETGTNRNGLITESNAYSSAVDKEYSKTFKVTADYPYMFLSCRNSDTTFSIIVSGAGEIPTLKVKVNALEEESKKLGDGVNDLLSRMDNLYKEATNKEFSFSATSGSDLSYRVSYNFKKGETYIISLVGTSGMIDSSGVNVRPNNEYNVNLKLNESKTFIPSNDYTYVTIARGGSGIKDSGELTFSVSTLEGGILNKIFDFVYVSPTGNDENTGTKSSPFKTLAKAISVSSRIIMRGGVYTSGVSFDSVANKDIKIYAYREEMPIIKLGRTIVGDGSERKVEGYEHVYSVTMAALPNSYVMYQDGVNDVSTLIGKQDFHPLYKGKKYRCDCTKIKPLSYSESNLQKMDTNVSSGIYNYAFDSANGVLYFTRPESSVEHPIIMPTGEHCFYNASDNNISVHLLGIAMYYGNCEILYSDNIIVEDCICKYCCNNGNFRWEKSKAVKFIRCESAVAWNANGDGFNGGSASVAIEPKKSTCYIIDCWSHDNNDDGYSDHDGCECRVIGGLYEYNGKAGITPSYGSMAMIDNVESRCNDRGFYYCGGLRYSNPAFAAGAKFKGCYADRNRYSGFDLQGSALDETNHSSNTGNGNFAICEDCTSVNNGHYGYEISSNNCNMYLRNCRSSNNGKGAKSSSNIIVNNAEIVS
jgi:hypothetical protein